MQSSDEKHVSSDSTDQQHCADNNGKRSVQNIQWLEVRQNGPDQHVQLTIPALLTLRDNLPNESIAGRSTPDLFQWYHDRVREFVSQHAHLIRGFTITVNKSFGQILYASCDLRTITCWATITRSTSQ